MWAELAKDSKEIPCLQNLVMARDCYSARCTYYASSYKNLIQEVRRTGLAWPTKAQQPTTTLWQTDNYNQFSDINISQGTVATPSKCSVIRKGFIANSQLSVEVEEFWKSVNICWRYEQECFWHVVQNAVKTQSLQAGRSAGWQKILWNQHLSLSVNP